MQIATRMKPKSLLNRSSKPSCTFLKSRSEIFPKKHIMSPTSVTAGKSTPKQASYYGRVVKVLDLRTNGQVSSWVRTPVVAFFLKTAVGNDFDAESKLMTVSKWFRQWNDSMNYDFHQITILLASIKNWKAPPVDIAIAIEKTSVASWVRTPVAAFLSERRHANENCHQNETEVNFISFTKTQQYFFEKPIGDFSQEAYNLTAWNSVRSKQAKYGRAIEA